MNDLIGRNLLKWRIRSVIPHIKGNLLDIGCGTNKLVKAYGNGIGIDVYDWGSVDLIVKDASILPFNDREFDTITIIAAFNHIPNRNSVIDECYRLLKDDGRLIVTMISPEVSKIWHKIREPWDEDQKLRGMKEGEVFGFHKRELVNIFYKHNFILAQYYKFMLRLNSIFVFSKIRQNS